MLKFVEVMKKVCKHVARYAFRYYGVFSDEAYGKIEEELFASKFKPLGIDPQNSYAYILSIAEYECTAKVFRTVYEYTKKLSNDPKKYAEFVFALVFKSTTSRIRSWSRLERAYRDMFIYAMKLGQEFFANNGWDEYSSLIKNVLDIDIKPVQRYKPEESKKC